jgi:TonB family protein
MGIYGRLGAREDIFFAPVYKVDLVSMPGETGGGGGVALPESGSRGKSTGVELKGVEREKAIRDALKSTKRIVEALKSVKGKNTEVAGKEKTTGATKGKTGSSTATGASSSGGILMDPAISEYYMMVKKRIEEVWSFPEGLFVPAARWELRIGVRIDRKGNIEESWLEKSSGNSYLDRSALRAVKKASPLPPIPAEIRDDPLDLGLVFTSQEVGK